MFEQVEVFYRPASVREVVRLLASGKGRARIVAGGTDLVVDADSTVRALIDITHSGLTYIRKQGGVCAIGAATTMAELQESRTILALGGGILARAAATCGSVQIRSVATVGGNLANGSPAADLGTPLLVLDAVVVVADAKGRRKLPIAEYLAAKGTKGQIGNPRQGVAGSRSGDAAAGAGRGGGGGRCQRAAQAADRRVSGGEGHKGAAPVAAGGSDRAAAVGKALRLVVPKAGAHGTRHFGGERGGRSSVSKTS